VLKTALSLILLFDHEKTRERSLYKILGQLGQVPGDYLNLLRSRDDECSTQVPYFPAISARAPGQPRKRTRARVPRLVFEKVAQRSGREVDPQTPELLLMRERGCSSEFFADSAEFLSVS
jgi:hypothetical protein